ERRDADLRAERSLGEADGHAQDQVVAVTDEQVVLLDADDDVQVAARSAQRARLALARHADGLAVVDPRRHLHRQLALFRLTTAAAALRALVRLGDGPARPAAVRTRGDHAEHPAE